jgi:hypothetical protein
VLEILLDAVKAALRASPWLRDSRLLRENIFLELDQIMNLTQLACWLSSSA